LIALIPLLSAFETNVQEVTGRELVVPILVTLSLTIGLWALAAWVLHDLARGALVASAAVFCFFNFGVVDNFLGRLTGAGSAEMSLWRSVAVLVVGVGVLVGVLWALLRRPKLLGGLTPLLNGFAALVVLALLGLLTSETILASRGNEADAARPIAYARPGEGTGPETGAVVPTTPNPPRRPDIYYIILDGYGRGDVLESEYDYDNSDFLDGLRKRGFYVADRATSNYCQTFLSLSSSLCGRYHDGPRLVQESLGREPTAVLIPAIRDSMILKTLRPHGYRLVSYDSGFIPTNMPDADFYRSPVPQTSPLALVENDFASLLLEKTPVNLYWKARARFARPEDAPADKYALYRELTLYAFENVGKEAAAHSPKFVFVHILCPHPPFVFGANGEDVSPRARPFLSSDGSYYIKYYGDIAPYVPGYRAQARFAARMAERAVDAILRNSPEPPIIILQSDHGPGSHWDCYSADPKVSDLRERMSILNAYYLPDGGDKALYASISPVNSFRVVLNQYFGAKLELLPDRCYLSSIKKPFEFVDVTDRVRGNSETRPK
jgi:hypothetical protein